MLTDILTLLQESESDIRRREAALADRLRANGTPIVLFGAGRLGRRTLAGLRDLGIQCLAFADNNDGAWGTQIDDLPVYSPAEATRRFGIEAIFVVTIWRAEGGHDFLETQKMLVAHGCREVISFIPLYWAFSERFLPYITIDSPHKISEVKERIIRAFDLLSDEQSKAEFAGQLNWRINADFSSLNPPVGHPQYLPDDLFSLTPDDVIADCGAFDGDTLRAVITDGHPFRSYFAFEPDPQSYQRLTGYLATLPDVIRKRIIVNTLAISDQRGNISFSAEGTGASSISQYGDITVETATLDELLADTPPTMIKMDIEGAEYKALRGCRNLLSRSRPILAIAVYHLQAHLWEIALLIDEFAEDYSFYLRPHAAEGFELIVYAIPRERLMKTNEGRIER